MPVQKNEDIEVILYTDGACSGNPGPGGWAYILHHVPSGKTDEKAGAEWETTNNRMEIQAIIEGLKRLKRPTRVKVITDSKYVVQSMTEWMKNWKKNNWRRRTKNGFEPVKNDELWKELDRLVSIHPTAFEHVYGHAGHAQNERCDEMAVNAYKQLIRSKGKSLPV